MPKFILEYELLPLLEKFVRDVKFGRHVQKSGKRIKKESLENYLTLYKHLQEFSISKQFPLRMKLAGRLSKKEFFTEQKYWKKFYKAFTDYLYDDLGNFDNYVGMHAKLLRSFFNYLKNQKGLNVGTFHSNFYVPHEDIQIVVLSPERLNYLIYSKEFETTLSQKLKEIKDIFVFGCTVALRVSDLMRLGPTNLERVNERTYLNVQSKKTQTFTRVKLPDYGVKILDKYNGRKRLLPYYHNVYLNLYIKELLELAGWTEPFARTRQRRGIPVVIYKETEKKTHYRFCDMVTTHTMRRTAITTMLSLGMNEQLARKISGHSSNSKEFYRYVSYSQTHIDSEIDSVHEKLNKKQLELA